MCAIANAVRASRKPEREDWREESCEVERVEESAAKEEVVEVWREREEMPPPRRIVEGSKSSFKLSEMSLNVFGSWPDARLCRSEGVCYKRRPVEVEMRRDNARRFPVTQQGIDIVFYLRTTSTVARVRSG